MSKAKNITDVLTEADLDQPVSPPSSGDFLPVEKQYAHWDAALAKYRQLQALRRKQDETFEELRFALETRRALAKLGKTYNDVEWFIPAEHLPKSGLQGQELRSKYGTILWNQTNKHGMRPDDIVGAKLKDGPEIWFDAPIQRFRKSPKEPSEKAPTAQAPKI